MQNNKNNIIIIIICTFMLFFRRIKYSIPQSLSILYCTDVLPVQHINLHMRWKRKKNEITVHHHRRAVLLLLLYDRRAALNGRREAATRTRTGLQRRPSLPERMSRGRTTQNVRVPFQSGMVLHNEQGVLRLSVQHYRLLQTRLCAGRRRCEAHYRHQ